MNLSKGETERLAMLAEEAGEVIQAVGKVLRHGYESYHPADLYKGIAQPGAESNRDRLYNELCDLLGVLKLMTSKQDLKELSETQVRVAMERKLKYSHFQGKVYDGH